MFCVITTHTRIQSTTIETLNKSYFHILNWIVQQSELLKSLFCLKHQTGQALCSLSFYGLLLTRLSVIVSLVSIIFLLGLLRLHKINVNPAALNPFLTSFVAAVAMLSSATPTDFLLVRSQFSVIVLPDIFFFLVTRY